MNQQILSCLSRVLKIDEAAMADISAYTPLADIGMDSIKFIQFIVAVEEAMSIEVHDSDLLMEKFRTLEDVRNTLSAYQLSEPVIKKCLILDCDNVLWQGAAGEEPTSIQPENALLQQKLLELYRQGFLLCLCSRNDQRFIWEAFAQPGMILTPNQIAAFRINRQNKAKNIQELAAELNLTTDSFVFIDDSDYELGLIRSMLPDVLCLKVNDPQVIPTLSTLFSSSPSADINRTQLYKEQKEREKSKYRYQTVEEYNRSLHTIYQCGPATPDQLPRLAELSQRTHQFNLANTHYTVDELARLLQKPEYLLFSLSVSDIYGDMGIVGMAVLHGDILEGFMLSCRVFDRDFEQILLNAIKDHANNREALTGIYRQTDKNARYQDFYQKNGVKRI